MTEHFTFDLFLSHSAKDREVVRPIAERLRKDGLRVWFDGWEGDDPEHGLEHSRVLEGHSAHVFLGFLRCL